MSSRIESGLTIEGSVRRAIERIEALSTVLSKVVLIRLEELT